MILYQKEKIEVNETEINKIKKGQEVKIKLSAIENKEYEGTIKSVSGLGTYQTSGTTFSVVVEFENDGNAKPGMSASCSITLEKAQNCIAVPINAVQTNNNQKYVVVVDENGNTQNVNIETGISNDSYVQVISGLNGGETIQMMEIVTTNSKSNFGGRENSNYERPTGMGSQNSKQMSMPSGTDMPDMSQRPSN